jgi:hypothetical protein
MPTVARKPVNWRSGATIIIVRIPPGTIETLTRDIRQ